ncbi:hypothetical protein GmHk_06G017064 [Glycine max]|nr:hypothetical protein GmHk_06G017064 [Glycine max]
MLKKYTNGRDLVRLGMTRFATAYLTFACLHEMKASLMRKTMPPVEWWEMFGDGCPELKWFAIHVSSLTSSSSGCELNWSTFEMVHAKRTNHLHQRKTNELIHVTYNLKLKSRQIRKIIALPFEDMESDDEWITKEGYDIFDEIEYNVLLEQPLGESDHFSIEEELEDDGDKDNGGSGDIGDGFITGLMDI